MKALDRSGCEAEQHGDYMAYTNHRCRCQDARRDWKRHKMQVANGTFQPLRVNALPTRRRLQGLMALGWTWADIGRKLEVGKGAVHQWATRPQVRQSTADKVKVLTFELEPLAPPDTRQNTQARIFAHKNGWPPPAAWDDIDDPGSGHAPLGPLPSAKERRARLMQKGQCLVDGCERAQFRAGLCFPCRRERDHEVQACGFPTCGTFAWRADHCGNHDSIGLDFKAGDWYDWVAVDQLWNGEQGARRPTVLEVLEVARRGDRAGIRTADLARQVGVEPEKFERWRYHSSRVVATFSQAAA